MAQDVDELVDDDVHLAGQGERAESGLDARDIAVVVGAGGYRGAGVTTNMRIALCADASCTKVLAEARPQVVNYGLTEANFDVAVTSGTTYFARWYLPDALSPNGGWDMYWWAGSTGPGPVRKPFGEAQTMRAVVKGYNR